MIWNMFSSRFLLPEFFFLHYQFNILYSTPVQTLRLGNVIVQFHAFGWHAWRTYAVCLRASKRELITLSVVPLLPSYMPMPPMANFAAHAICSLV